MANPEGYRKALRLMQKWLGDSILGFVSRPDRHPKAFQFGSQKGEDKQKPSLETCLKWPN
ncbi:MAG: hypothetical protein IPL23_20090 [Saprospiraceae bacterium]|nr:hypothetical protein [Saprospiraceae bacterium]